MKITPKSNIGGKITIPGDKSITHRALILAAIADGTTEIEGALLAEDCLATIDCLRKLGVPIELDGTTDIICVHGVGLHGLKKPADTLYVGNSGTTLRLLAGLLAGQPFESTVDGDASIRRRPMDRVAAPLAQMGALVAGATAPVSIKPTKLTGINYTMPIASAQVKSAILLAALYARGQTAVQEPTGGITRDHTENIFAHMGIGLDIISGNSGKIIKYSGGAPQARKIRIPRDFSSAAFFLVAGALLATDGLTMENIGINPTRTGLLDALQEMGAQIELKNRKMLDNEEAGDIFVKKSPLRAITLRGAIIPRMIDEIPIFIAAALFAQGTTIIRDAQELTVKESNRITAMAAELTKMGAKIKPLADGMVIDGGFPLHGATVDSHNDHRVAMALAVAAMAAARGDTEIQNTDCINTSFPDFLVQILSKTF